MEKVFAASNITGNNNNAAHRMITLHNPVPDTGSIVSTDTVFSWTCHDPENDPLTYEIYFGVDPDPPFIGNMDSDTIFNPGTMEYCTQYYWKIIAQDDHGNYSEGPVWNFRTVGNNECGCYMYDQRNGEFYNTVQIGDQCWMKENMNIGNHVSSQYDQTDDGIFEKYCFMDNIT